MAYKAGQAGKSTREMASKRRKTAIIMAVIAMVMVILIGLLLQNSKALGIGGIGVLILLMLLRIIPDLADSKVIKKKKEERRAVRGAIAEERVGDLLEQLGEDYCVFHDVASPYGNIDHVVLGKHNGVFLIETKSHGGKVSVADEKLLVNGKPPEKDFITQSLKNTFWLRDKLSGAIGEKVWITPVIVFTNAFVPASKPVKGVYILNKKYLNRLIGKRKAPAELAAKLWNIRADIEAILL
jgi:hypothetical protein